MSNRRWFQLHLSTVVVLVLVAGVLLGLNMRPPRQPDCFQGWPWVYRASIAPSYWDGSHGLPKVWFYWSELYLDCAVWLLILAAVAVVCEMLARRKAKL